MSNRIAFQTQLASIMEVLANAAVAEICKLVDDDYAVINLQMTQCQRENKALKRKLHILELKMARGLAERRIGSLSRTNRVHVTAAAAALTDKYRNQNNDVAFGGQFNAGLWSDAGSGAGGEQKPLGVSNSMTGETISDIENVLIKVEAFEEAPTQQSVFMGDCGLAASPSQTAVQMVNEVGDDQVSRMQRQTLEQEPIKSEESESVAIMGDLKKWEDAQIRAIIVQDGEPNTSTSTTSPDKSAGTYGTEPIEVAVPHLRNNEGSQKKDFSALHLNIQGAIERNPPHSQQSSYHAYTESDPEQDCVLICSETVSSKTLSQEQKSKTTADGPIRMEKRRNQEQSRFSKHTAASSEFNPSCNSVLSQTNSYLPQPGTSSVSVEVLNHAETSRGKGFVCKYCDRGFRGMSNLMAHQRVHTGERPFKCDTCGKRFTEAGNLKKHQRVHTGEKPYVCFRCGKRFGWICNLKAHQQSASCGRN